MALSLTLDVVAPGVLAWSQANVVVPARLSAAVSGYEVGAVVEAECAYLPAGLTVKSILSVRQPSGALDAQLSALVERENWRGVLTRLEGAPKTARREGVRALAQSRLGDHEAFANTYSALVSLADVELMDSTIGLWALRRQFPDERWAVVDRRVRAQTWQLLWQAVLRSRGSFRAHPFADSLWSPLDRLLEAVEPEARPPRVMAGGPRIEFGFDGTEVLARGALALEPLAASAADWAALEPACRALAESTPKSRDGVEAFRRRAGSETSLANVVTNLVNGLTRHRGDAAIERAVTMLGALLVRQPASVAAEYLAQLDAIALCDEARGLVPKRHAALKGRITAVHYRGSLQLKRDELDAVLGEAGGRWFALRKHDGEWLCVEGSRDDVLATMPDALFEEAVVKLLAPG